MSLSRLTSKEPRFPESCSTTANFQRRHVLLFGDGEIDDNKMTRCVCYCMFVLFSIWFHPINTIGRVESCQNMGWGGKLRRLQIVIVVSRFVEAMASEWYGRLCSCTVLRYFIIFLPLHRISNDFMIRIGGKLGKLFTTCSRPGLCEPPKSRRGDAKWESRDCKGIVDMQTWTHIEAICFILFYIVLFCFLVIFCSS